jgi:hypothetical protein
MPETARYLARLAGDQEQAGRVIAQISGSAADVPPPDRRGFREVLAIHSGPILAASLLWMIYDLVVYGSILFGPSLIGGSLGIPPVPFSLLMEALFVIPASAVFSLFIIDRVGRKPLQVWGFFAGAILVGVFAIMQGSLMTMPVTALFVYGFFNVALTGPGLVSGAGILGVELAPTRIRTVAQSITVAGGRIGAAVSAFGFPLLFAGTGQAGAYWVITGLSVIGAVLTQLLVPETGRITLEAITESGR